MKAETKVIFRKFREGDIIALFPTMAGDCDNGATCNSYQHIGQHGSASPLLVQAHTVAAKPGEYADLLRELKRIGYADLRIARRFTRADYQERRKQCDRP